MLKVYEIIGSNGLPYKVQLSPAAAEKLGAVEVKDGKIEKPAASQKKAGTRAKATSDSAK
ncbi:hypothetical protein [Rothia nasimurium]|uniref:hypothetical protein n=1 Tax=Rothia nasimurium TaxID=85336 RepID=UPI001F2CD5A7|nr:hypothetical protein [Rothia nasimurium]